MNTIQVKKVFVPEMSEVLTRNKMNTIQVKKAFVPEMSAVLTRNKMNTIQVKRAYVPVNISSNLASAYCPYCQTKNTAWVEGEQGKPIVTCLHFEKVAFLPEMNPQERQLWREREHATYTTRFKKEWHSLDKRTKKPEFVFQLKQS